MKKLQFFRLLMALTVCLSFRCWTQAAEQAASPAAEAVDAPTAEELAMDQSMREHLDDPAFNQYVDITLLEPAWAEKNAVLLTDIALQIADGQKVLMRPHKAGSAQDMLKLAAAIATRKGDKDTIARIESAAKTLNFDDVASEASKAAKLAAAPRAADPALTVSLDQADPDDVAAFGSLLDGVQSAHLLRDKAWLDEVGERSNQLQNLTGAQKKYINKILGEARSAISDDTDKTKDDNSVVSTISKLDSASRHHGHDHWGHHDHDDDDDHHHHHHDHDHDHDHGWGHGWGWGWDHHHHHGD
jgi:hypothetical protein